MTYGLIIDCAGRNNDIHMALELKQEMRRKGMVPPLSAYTALINHMQRVFQETDSQQIREVIKEMLDEYKEVDERAYETILGAYANMGDVEAVYQFFKQIPIRWRTMTLYNLVLEACTVNGKSQHYIQEIYKQMVDNGHLPDRFTFSTSMRTFVQTENWNNFETMMNTMIATGMRFKSRSFRTLLLSLKRREQWRYIITLYENLSPLEDLDWVLSDVVLQAFKKTNSVKKEQQFFDRLLARFEGLEPADQRPPVLTKKEIVTELYEKRPPPRQAAERVFNVALRNLMRLRDYESSQALLERMFQRNVPINPVNANILATYMAITSATNKTARTMVELMSRVKLDDYCLHILMGMHTRRGMWMQVVDTFYKIEKPDVTHFSLAIRASKATWDLGHVTKLILAMIANMATVSSKSRLNMAGNIRQHLNEHIPMLLRRNLTHQALKIVDEVEQLGITVSKNTRQQVMAACAAQKPSDTLKMLNDIQNLHARDFNLLLSSFKVKDLVETGTMLFERMKEAGVYPETEALNEYFAILARENQAELAIKIKSACPVTRLSGDVYDSLLVACESDNNISPEQIISLFEEMKTFNIVPQSGAANVAARSHHAAGHYTKCVELLKWMQSHGAVTQRATFYAGVASCYQLENGVPEIVEILDMALASDKHTARQLSMVKNPILSLVSSVLSISICTSFFLSV